MRQRRDLDPWLCGALARLLFDEPHYLHAALKKTKNKHLAKKHLQAPGCSTASPNVPGLSLEGGGVVLTKGAGVKGFYKTLQIRLNLARQLHRFNSEILLIHPAGLQKKLFSVGLNFSWIL